MNILNLVSSQIKEPLMGVLQKAGELSHKRQQGAVMVGGCVRDLVMKKPVFDVDFMLEPPAGPVVQELGSIFKAQIKSHERFHTFTLVLPNGYKIDVATAREERYPSPAQLPVVTPSTIENDLKRRDFSINAIASWITPNNFGDIKDPLGGLDDIKHRQIRVLHSKSFDDDPTRLYRAARFAARLKFKMEPKTEDLIKEAIHQKKPALLTPVRLRHEFELILKEEHPLEALTLLSHWGALTFINKDWKIMGAHRSLLEIDKQGQPNNNLLEKRLVAWFKPWGKSRSKDMMNELKFERAMKKEVLSQLE